VDWTGYFLDLCCFVYRGSKCCRHEPCNLLGIDPLVGLIAGSITLTGGHGTAGAWGEILETQHGIQGALAGMASATFGLIIGGIIGGPLAKLLINRYSLAEKVTIEIKRS
jgi:ESS family glutamate:Na+ symporter